MYDVCFGVSLLQWGSMVADIIVSCIILSLCDFNNLLLCSKFQTENTYHWINFIISCQLLVH